VTANVHTPPRPWEIEDCIEERVFVDDYPILLNQPKILTVSVDGHSPSTVKYFLADDEEIDVREPAYAALVGACRLAVKRRCKEIALSELLQDSTIWPNGTRPAELNDEARLVRHLRDHAKPLLHDAIWISGKEPPTLEFRCAVKEVTS